MKLYKLVCVPPNGGTYPAPFFFAKGKPEKKIKLEQLNCPWHNVALGLNNFLGPNNQYCFRTMILDPSKKRILQYPADSSHMACGFHHLSLV